MFFQSIAKTCKTLVQEGTTRTQISLRMEGQLRESVEERISDLNKHFKSPKCKVLNQPTVEDTLYKLHKTHVLVPADKPTNNVTAVCKK